MRGSRARGKTFERRFGKGLRDLGLYVVSGQWLHFIDANGEGWAQPDHVVFLPESKNWQGTELSIQPPRIVIIENKLSFRPMGLSQLSRLYTPLIQALHPGVPVGRVLACRYLRPGCPTALLRPLPQALYENLSIVHWIH